MKLVQSSTVESVSEAPPTPAPQKSLPKDLEELVQHLIGLQTFEGTWAYNEDELLKAMRTAGLTVNAPILEKEVQAGQNADHIATALVITVFEVKLAEWQGSWELIVDKARGFLEMSLMGGLDELVERVKKALE